MNSKVRILVAEDDQTTREGLEELLRLEGFAVEAVANGALAWKLWEKVGADLLLLDIMMPKLDGYALCRKIRAQDERVPVIFLSAKASEIDRVIGLELGADDYLPKPFGARELLARVRSVLRRSELSAPTATQHNQSKQQKPSQEEFSLGEWHICPKQLCGQMGGKSVELSARECALLQVFSRYPKEVIHRDVFYDEVWGYEHMPNSRSLDQAISMLRRKLEQNPAHPEMILTVHGVGYRLGEG